MTTRHYATGPQCMVTYQLPTPHSSIASNNRISSSANQPRPNKGKSFFCKEIIDQLTYEYTKVKVCLYYIIPQYPVRFTLHPGQTCSFRHQLDLSGKRSSTLQLLCDDYSFIFLPMSIVRYSFESTGAS